MEGATAVQGSAGRRTLLGLQQFAERHAAHSACAQAEHVDDAAVREAWNGAGEREAARLQDNRPGRTQGRLGAVLSCVPVPGGASGWEQGDQNGQEEVDQGRHACGTATARAVVSRLPPGES